MQILTFGLVSFFVFSFHELWFAFVSIFIEDFAKEMYYLNSVKLLYDKGFLL